MTNIQTEELNVVGGVIKPNGVDKKKIRLTEN